MRSSREGLFPREIKAPIFDLKELSVYDGPGIRVTAFYKGCPMRCLWCHNPEGLSASPQVMVDRSACTHCGRCEHIDECDYLISGICSGCGRCIAPCPAGCRRIAGTMYTPQQLADKLLRCADMFAPDDGCDLTYPDGADDMGGGRRFYGGVTFSGGEPTLHAEHLCATCDILRENMAETGFFSLALETCGCCKPESFAEVLRRVDLVYFDIKHTDPVIHRRLTGRDNTDIIANLHALAAAKIPFILRHTLIPGVNDDADELRRTAELCATLGGGFIRAELLPYNTAAGAKYPMTLKEYAPTWDEKRKPNTDISAFSELGVECRVM